ncbi:hypothetical protein PGTUg99_007650, partial [Puccinia graminis f. sp. tritici]
ASSGTSKTEPAAQGRAGLNPGRRTTYRNFLNLHLQAMAEEPSHPSKTTEHQEYKQSNHSTCPFEAWKIKEKRTVIRK